jgi:HEAT repeat protein
LSLESYLIELSDESKPIVFKKLANLSALSTENLMLFLEGFANMGAARRMEIIEKLVELAEENIDVNFNDIFIACLQDPDAAVRASAIEGLWEDEDRSIIDPLISILHQDSEETVRAAAATALGKFAMLAELGEMRQQDGDKVQKALLTVIENGKEGLEVRRRAIESLAPFDLPKVTNIIREAYNSNDYEMRVSAIYAMGMNCDPQWLDTLIAELGNTDAEMRYEAARACGEIAEEKAVPCLVKLIHDPDLRVKLAAIAALGNIGGSEAEAALEACLNDPDEYIHDAVEDTLDELHLNKDPFTFRI